MELVKLFIALLVMGLVPALYTTFRTYLIGQMPGEWSYSIAGQLSWVNLIYEVLDEAIILPLFFFLSSPEEDKAGFSNRIKTGLLISGSIYAFLACLLCALIHPLLNIMAADPGIITESARYIQIETIANIFGILFRFLCVAIIAAGKDKYVYGITGAKLFLCLFFDSCLVSELPYSLKLGINGIGYSNIITNLILTLIAFMILKKEGFIMFSQEDHALAC